ncbi:gasp precursor, partial [Danaus plexippus plexippus]
MYSRSLLVLAAALGV